MQIFLGLLKKPIGCLGLFLVFSIGVGTSSVTAGELRSFPREQMTIYGMKQRQVSPPKSKYYEVYEKMRADIEGLSDPALRSFKEGLIVQLQNADRAGDSARVEYYLGLIKFVNEVRR